MKPLLNLIAGLAVSLALAATAKAQDRKSLDDYRWSHRPVLMFHDGKDAACLLCEMGFRDEVADGFIDRDIIFIEVTPDGTRSWVDGGSGGALAETPERLRERFGVEEASFTAILIGKDGGEKGRWTEPPSWEDDIFPLIDSMPMRRRELGDD
ncbi:hypothetical protein GCM10011342_29960 [Aquisalinus flavus]|uniref:DUF4174 domain-containing protein n=1 Tax=Aquisalinus flavus TaxID=1526572 RepID=A0A8J2Y4F8_9PROT|nr:DUF4174 domain-containing protein [Aquisalinus flavus]MBD0428025.1 DUF4174 domain-containing protein [Aquisalinus flavus]GGD19296.1 hypothetical protein GCM10011342_29960 [Aquisalinus flavus]